MLIEFIIRHLLARRVLHPFWERVNKASLYGMNVGGGNTVSRSGELWVIDFFSRQYPNNKPVIVFDVGAHVGHYASAMISRFGKSALLYCFEPSRSSFEALGRNLGQNENVQLFNFGFGDREESVTLYVPGPGSGQASVYNRRIGRSGIGPERAEEICLKTLDTFCRDKGIRHIDFLKLDVEGHELSVLNGAQEMIGSGSIAYMQFEFGPGNIDSRTYFRDFFSLLDPHFRIFRVLKDGLAPVMHYNEVYENFLTTNYLGISRFPNRGGD